MRHFIVCVMFCTLFVIGPAYAQQQKQTLSSDKSMAIVDQALNALELAQAAQSNLQEKLEAAQSAQQQALPLPNKHNSGATKRNALCSRRSRPCNNPNSSTCSRCSRCSKVGS